mgnify:FL=1
MAAPLHAWEAQLNLTERWLRSGEVIAYATEQREREAEEERIRKTTEALSLNLPAA